MNNKFLESVAGILETGEVSFATRFREVEGWSSLMAFGLMVMMENDWQTPVTIDDFLKMETVRDLMREAFITFAAELLKVGREELKGESAMGSLPEWDSVNHLRLVMEAEKRFGFSYRLEEIPAIKTIDDFIR